MNSDNRNFKNTKILKLIKFLLQIDQIYINFYNKTCHHAQISLVINLKCILISTISKIQSLFNFSYLTYHSV